MSETMARCKVTMAGIYKPRRTNMTSVSMDLSLLASCDEEPTEPQSYDERDDNFDSRGVPPFQNVLNGRDVNNSEIEDRNVHAFDRNEYLTSYTKLVSESGQNGRSNNSSPTFSASAADTMGYKLHEEDGYLERDALEGKASKDAKQATANLTQTLGNVTVAAAEVAKQGSQQILTRWDRFRQRWQARPLLVSEDAYGEYDLAKFLDDDDADAIIEYQREEINELKERIKDLEFEIDSLKRERDSNEVHQQSVLVTQEDNRDPKGEKQVDAIFALVNSSFVPQTSSSRIPSLAQQVESSNRTPSPGTDSAEKTKDLLGLQML